MKEAFLHSGGEVFRPTEIAAIEDISFEEKLPRLVSMLTPREIPVFFLLADGMKEADIARDLGKTRQRINQQKVAIQQKVLFIFG